MTIMRASNGLYLKKNLRFKDSRGKKLQAGIFCNIQSITPFSI